MKKLHTLLAASAAGILALSACGQSGTPETGGGGGEGGGDTAAEAPQYEVASDVDLADSPTWSAANDAGTLKVGVKFDQPGLGNKDATADAPEGFDIEIAKITAAALGFEPDQIEWVETVSANREPFLQQGNVDLVVATYTINDERKEVVDFAGPYYVAGQDLLVAEDSEIAGPDDLAGTTVCSVDGSTPAQRIQDEYGDAELVTYDAYSKCVEDLQTGNVDAVTTDDAILRGYAAQYEGEFKVVGEPFSDEPYGIGLPKDDQALRDAVNDALEQAGEDGTWTEAFEYTLGDSSGVEQPAVDRY
ncbi:MULTISPECIES: glutamate ABC transporter substrate-binding protein [unclassified Brevibacterium]|uniref:glutamate ABC transporter substrate-binding protein n=1 Tax=unclassified Brevibacterium TaxID=2614124 RepID=UPI0010C79582|nr:MULTISPECIES: glutamate ABC transporter substrate-binding protein [Actinomycetes]MCK1803552.1 glutamate ABC transporter substrate-binding protein [Brevibacterium sp. R8603A2]MCX0278042.1 glutamate ABC transporter substrate-binding protein [Nocardia zapadnayensis]QCP05645.1 glutamate ABC transporter substrate-binding protein [Brevibacterium sp. CS2]